MFTNSVIEKIRNNLFETPKVMAENGLKEFERERVLHLRDMYNYWLQYPTTREKDILQEVEKRFGVDRATAYNYVGADAMIKALDKFAKYNNLDKPDSVDFQWESILPQQFVMSDDPTTIGFKAIPNIREKIKAKINQYWNQQIEDVRFEELEGKRHIRVRLLKSISMTLKAL